MSEKDPFFGRVNPLAALTQVDRGVRQLVAGENKRLHELGWATGSGGGVSIRQGDFVYIAPQGVKEHLSPADVFVLDLAGQVVEAPGNRQLTLSPCAPAFVQLHRERGAGAVLHSHSLNAFLATVLFDDVFFVKDTDILKKIEGLGDFAPPEIPIIDHSPLDAGFADSLSLVLRSHPQAEAVLMRRHGVYLWGADHAQVKIQADRTDQLFNAAIQLKQMGIDPTTA